MKTIIQFLLAALVINGCIQGARSAWRQYEFKDAVEQEMRFGRSTTPLQLQHRLIQVGDEHGVALSPEDVTVEKRGQQTHVALSYTDGIALVPRVYTYRRNFDVTLSVEPLHALTPDNR